MGIVSSAIRHAWRMTAPVAVAEFKTAPLLQGYAQIVNVQSPPVYPAIERDVALLVPVTLTHAEILATIQKAAPPELENVALFDIFTGNALEPGTKSLAYCLTYRSSDRTLTDEEANAYHTIVKDELKRLPQVTVREG